MKFSTPIQTTFQHAVLGTIVCILASCVTVPKEDRLLTSGSTRETVARGAFDGGDLRLLSWNVHKAAHADLHLDLSRYAAENDFLLIQEVVLDAAMRELLERAGFSWQMADAFSVGGLVRGVLVAAKIQPVSAKVVRTNEPLFPIPKSAIITLYPFGNQRTRLAVANLHGINFTLCLGRFREQLDALAMELENHDGPIIFGGDLNTWSRSRNEALCEVAHQLGLTAVEPFPDERRLAFGRHLDHLYVRGFKVLNAHSPEAPSSDHNPILVRLRPHPSPSP